MNHEEKITELEEKERALMLRSIEGATKGTVSPTLHPELAEVRKALKTARRVRAMDAKRTEPKRTSRFSILLPDDELSELTKRAEEKKMIFSNYIRHLIKIGLKVEDEAYGTGKSGA